MAKTSGCHRLGTTRWKRMHSKHVTVNGFDHAKGDITSDSWTSPLTPLSTALPSDFSSLQMLSCMLMAINGLGSSCIIHGYRKDLD